MSALPKESIMDRWITNGPRWLMLAALVYAPWAYGATRPWTITSLNWLLGAVVGLWFLGQLLRQRLPKPPSVMVIAGGGLLLQAWLMVFNARYEYDQVSHEFITLTPLLSWAPGSLDRELSIESATRLSLLLLSGFVAAEMAEQKLWRRRLLTTMAITGTSIVLLGLAQRFTNAPGIFWQQENFGPNFFATFRNHTNAGAFINLIWPLTVAWAVREKLRGTSPAKTIYWSIAAVVCITGVMVNTSRAATALAVFLLAIAAIWIIWQGIQGRFGTVQPSTLLIAGTLAVLLIGALAFLTGLDSNAGRWKQIDKQFTEDNTRLLAAKVCLKMIPESSWWGFGPGTFETAFPYFSQDFGEQLKGRWIYAHQDYLQTLTEWGYIGFGGWGMLFCGAMFCSWRRRIQNRSEISDSARTTVVGITLALASVMGHAMVDFPLQIFSIQLYALTLLSILWSSKHWMSGVRRMPVRRTPRRQTDALAVAS